jgi:hypothetical protein
MIAEESAGGDTRVNISLFVVGGFERYLKVRNVARDADHQAHGIGTFAQAPPPFGTRI